MNNRQNVPYNNPYGSYNPDNMPTDPAAYIDPNTGQPYAYDQYYEGAEGYDGYDDEYYEDYGNLDEDDFDQMAELEREMQGVSVGGPSKGGASNGASGGGSRKGSGGSFVPAGAMPSQGGVLSAHAAEFWFPECRNCSCCKGFKHGCDCCKKPGVDTCTNAGCMEQDPAASIVNSTDDKPTATSTASAAARASVNVPKLEKPSESVTKSENPTTVFGNGRELCKFFQQGNCRFGAACHFSHGTSDICAATSPPTSDNTTTAPVNAGGKSPCFYFKEGRCNRGATCKFSHD